MKSFVVRFILSVIVCTIYGWVDTILNPIAVLESGQTAGAQFQASDQAYIWSYLKMNFFSHFGLPSIVLLIILAIIWFPYLKKWASLLTKLAIIALIGYGIYPDTAKAYFDTTDKAEAYFILPNESAFWIPDVGDNKSSQSNLDSEAYFNANKIPTKRFIVPHHKFQNSGGWIGADAYVPDGRLIIVDRTPYSKEWLAAADKGTSSKNEGIECQSKEGINITVGVSIAASVTEANAAKFLYRFGVQPPEGNRTDPKVIFTSVYYGRSLSSVMDDIGRKKVETLICGEIQGRSFDQANADANMIMDKVSKEVNDYFATLGITLDFIGYADTWTFDESVQKAIDDRYVAQTVSPIMPILQALADVKVKEGLANGLSTRGLPSNLITIPESLLGAVGSLFGKASTAAPSK
jgi:hypothetical protein